MNNYWQKLIRKLHNKKYRKSEQLFIVEGHKSVLELFSASFEIQAIFYTQKFEEEYHTELNSISCIKDKTTPDILSKVGVLTSNNTVIAVVKIPEQQSTPAYNAPILLALDNINDPGNLGTIIRMADWYGIPEIICSKETADFFNPKVISATKGSFSRVRCIYTDLEEALSLSQSKGYKIAGTFMEGTSIYNYSFEEKHILLMGNESIGISDTIEKIVDQKITIPARGKAESLNVAIATAICLDNCFRNQ